MSVRTHKMHKPLFYQRTGKLLNLRSECPRQASRRHLQQAALLDQRTQDAWLVQQTAIPFRMRQNPYQPRSRKFAKQSIQRNIDIVRQFEKHVTAPIA